MPRWKIFRLVLFQVLFKEDIPFLSEFFIQNMNILLTSRANFESMGINLLQSFKKHCSISTYSNNLFALILLMIWIISPIAFWLFEVPNYRDYAASFYVFSIALPNIFLYVVAIFQLSQITELIKSFELVIQKRKYDIL